MADERVTGEDATIVPAGIVGAAAGGSMGGALGATDLIAEAEETAEGGASTGTLPGDEVSVVEDPDVAPGVEDRRGIMERITDAVTHDDSGHIDPRSGTSV